MKASELLLGSDGPDIDIPPHANVIHIFKIKLSSTADILLAEHEIKQIMSHSSSEPYLCSFVIYITLNESLMQMYEASKTSFFKYLKVSSEWMLLQHILHMCGGRETICFLGPKNQVLLSPGTEDKSGIRLFSFSHPLDAIRHTFGNIKLRVLISLQRVNLDSFKKRKREENSSATRWVRRRLDE